MLSIIHAENQSQLTIIRELFLEYADQLGFELDFQNFDRDINELPGKYAPPDGRLFLALYDNRVAGCVALRRHSDDACEMKRLWVKPEFRGKRIGRALAEKLIDEARVIGYKKVVLDTIDTMVEAVALYKLLGFVETDAYYDNPIEGATYFVKDLTADSSG
ncbi:MAG: GNAT family N-acetyltransferase [Candidatus Zixiibacteriota bacterium]|nr:MAG: GNAT family N-acetyltransferase [candidate division Zixibacteria bacterium]